MKAKKQKKKKAYINTMKRTMTRKKSLGVIKRIRSNLGTITETIMDCPDPYEYPEGKAVVRIVEALDELEAYLK